MDFKIYAVDFDGTLCENKWPDIGEPNTRLIELLKKEKAAGTAKLILWTCRVSERLENAIAWCKERGLTFDAVNENLPESQEMFGGNPRKIFAHEYIDDRSSNTYGLPFHVFNPGATSSWAEQEIELACMSEREGVEKPGDADYGINCYKSAFKAFKSLAEDGHSGFSIQITKSLLNRLIDGLPLTPIQDTPDIWNESPLGDKDGTKEYQCKRMSALFKTVKPDGTTTYSDIHRVNCVNIDNPDVAFTNGIARRFVDKLYPITMPYLPSSKKFTLYTEEFLYNPKNGDYDTMAYLYLVTPEGERVEVNRYFKELAGKFVPISKDEYERRKAERKK